ncbi:MAG: shikimate dehydrogenase [Candidatus Sericytochromatia bacterium]|nr:shikimate dehydrogenase [Candidatus Sericytochromatia bacterium]
MNLTNPKSIIILGYPLEHTLSPKIHNFAFKYHNLDYVYTAYPIAPDKLSEMGKYFLHNLPICGGNVTVPFKEIIFNYLDKFTEEASQVGAVNTFYQKDNQLWGDNTDVYGFLQSVDIYKDYFENKKVLLLGTGGSAKAIITALNNLNVKEIAVVSRELEKSNTFVVNKNNLNPNINMVSLDYDSLINYDGLSDFSAIINCTPVGMYENISPLPKTIIDRLNNDALVYDLIYNPSKSKLLSLSEARGLKIINGKMMLIYQASKSFKIWTGYEFPIDQVTEII